MSGTEPAAPEAVPRVGLIRSANVAPVPPRTPLLPVAAAATGGILLVRYADPQLALLAMGVAAALIALLLRWHVPAAVLYLWTATFFLAASWYQLRRQPPADDIGQIAKPDGTTVRVRGVILTDPIVRARPDDGLRSWRNRQRTTTTLETRAVWHGDRWVEAQGRIRVTIGGGTVKARVGDEVEAPGHLFTIDPPANPGEFDFRQQAEDQGIRAWLYVSGADRVTRRDSSTWSLSAALARLRLWGVQQLRTHLSAETEDVAAAMLLGDRSALQPGWIDKELTPTQFERYQRTGVFHVLAISGQHLVILCAAFWWVLRLCGLSRPRVAGLMIVLTLGYTLLTGANMPAVRAAAVLGAYCLGILLRRQSQPVNTLALAWLVVIIINPADLFDAGCQLSFLAVLVMYQVIRPWHAVWFPWHEHSRGDPLDPQVNLAALIEESRPLWQRVLLSIWRLLYWAVLGSLAIWLASALLIANQFHLVSPIAGFLSPFAVLFTSVALVCGLPFLLLSALGDAPARPLAWVMESSLDGCAWLVGWAERIPGGYWYTAGVPEWCLWVFYAGLLAVLLIPQTTRHWRTALAAGAVWVALSLLMPALTPKEDGLRCSFLAVDHGVCVVIETPDGRVLLYDAGSMTGPEVTTRQIAPFLWHRGITRIDELFLSHADLDHFNGVPALLERFDVARVSLTPSFREDSGPGVAVVARALDRYRVPWRILTRGDRLEAGPLEIKVLHPPTEGPAGDENERSMVLHLKYAGRSVLLTGDLEGKGLAQVTNTPISPVDVMLAPHHGSPASNTRHFADWARAGLVISSEERPFFSRPDPYKEFGGVIWRTFQEGAVIVRIDESGIRAETFRSAKRWRRSSN